MYVAHRPIQYLWKLKASALLSTSTASTGLDRGEEYIESQQQENTKPSAIEGSGCSVDSTEDRPSVCHRVIGWLIIAALWLGFIASLILTLVGIWTPYRNCLTIGVILAIVCLGVTIHNCLRRGDTTPAIPIYVRRDSRLSVSCDLEVAELEDEIAEAEVDADAGSKCISPVGNRSVLTEDENGSNGR